MLVSWVLFRSADLGRAVAYYADMLGLGTSEPSALLIGGIILQPYYLSTLAVASWIAWRLPQSWDWSRRLPVWKAAVCLALLGMALVALSTQAYNPFIYFIF